jgi:hypothetical protein
VAVEAQDVLDAVLAHDSYVNGISRVQIRMADDDVPSPFDDLEVHRQHVIDNLEQHVEAWLDRIAAINRYVTVKDLLQNLGIGDEPAFFGDRSFEQTTSVNLMRVFGAHQVHRDVGVNENHSFASP